LVRYLRRDDPNEKVIRRELLKSDVISNDLIPLIKSLKSKKDAELFDITLRLLVNLTQSALNCFELKIPEEKLKFNIFLEIDNYLKKTKESFADEQFIKIICEKLKEIISKNWEDRPEEEDLIAERILYLIRNILEIKPSDEDTTNRLETDINSHDLLILLENFFLFFH
jgi:timeless